jgi:hypothetical protein
MTPEQRYYRWAGYWAIPCMGVPLIQLLFFHVFDYRVFFFFGTVGLLFAVSGIWKGEKRGRFVARLRYLCLPF